MEVLLNDKSFVGQYTEAEFILYCKDNIVPILKLLDKYGMSLLKEYSAYNGKVTKDKSFLDFLHMRGNPVLDSMKGYLIQLTRDPFWNENMRTRMDIEYQCEIDEMPNCITEAYERNGIIFSFEDEQYKKDYLHIVCEKNEGDVRNFYNLQLCKHHLEQLGYIVSWNKNSFIVESLGYKFEIRFKEEHHNVAHFHLSNSDESISVSIPDADILEGTTINRRELISWGMNNMKYIVELWNKIHPEMIVDYTK